MTSNTSENQTKRGPFGADSFVQWAIAALALTCFVAFLGCKNESDDFENPSRTLITPLAAKVPYEFEGTVRRNWGGDEFEIIEGRVVHYVRLAGVLGPEPGQPDWEEARRLLWIGLIGKNAKVHVIGRDKCMCEIGSIRVGDIDFGLKLLEEGMGMLDAINDFDNAEAISLEAYQAAEGRAREAKLGIWKRDSAMLPDEFRKRQEDQYLKFLKSLSGLGGD